MLSRGPPDRRSFPIGRKCSSSKLFLAVYAMSCLFELLACNLRAFKRRLSAIRMTSKAMPINVGGSDGSRISFSIALER